MPTANGQPDDVLPWLCNTVCLLILYYLAELGALWKQCRMWVSVMNLSVQRVCNPWSTGSTAICHRTCLLETLAQPNYCVFVTTERSTDVGDVPQASMVNAWIGWFWFSLGMFSDKRCEIKCVFPFVVGIRIISIHISCDMYLHVGLHVQIGLYCVLPYKVKILAQHGIGFILDRCIVYLGLTMPKLMCKRNVR